MILLILGGMGGGVRGAGLRGCGERDVCCVCVNWDEHLSAFQVHDSGVGRQRDDVMDQMISL